MPRYRALEKCFVDNCFRNEGDVFEYDGPSLRYLESLTEAPVSQEPVAEEPAVITVLKKPKRKYTYKYKGRRVEAPPSDDV